MWCGLQERERLAKAHRGDEDGADLSEKPAGLQMFPMLSCMVLKQSSVSVTPVATGLMLTSCYLADAILQPVLACL